MKINNIYKIRGINIISLIIGSALGAFILSVIVKISFSITNNYQIIKATSELSISARQLNNFFTQAFSANGYQESGSSLPISNVNFFGIDTSNNETKFYLWYSAGISGALLCSGQPVAYNASNPPTFLRISLNVPTSAGTTPYTICKDATISSPNLPPIVNPKQFNNFYLFAITNISTTSSNLTNVSIDSHISPSSPSYGTTRGIRLAIVLKSTTPVFNTARSVTFNIFNQQTISFNDKFLYKLVIIQSPFFYTALNPNNTTLIQKCDFTKLHPDCAYASITGVLADNTSR